MNNRNNYHWGATNEIMEIIRNREQSPETQKLVRRRTEIVKPGALRIKRDSQGNEHWIPRRPDANGRREVVEIDLKLIERKRRQQETKETESRDQSRQGTSSSIRPRNGSDSEILIITNPTGTLYPAINTNEFGNEPVQTIENLQINKVIPQPNKKRQKWKICAVL